jgi:hypothetical protein
LPLQAGLSQTISLDKPCLDSKLFGTSKLSLWCHELLKKESPAEFERGRFSRKWEYPMPIVAHNRKNQTTPRTEIIRTWLSGWLNQLR